MSLKDVPSRRKSKRDRIVREAPPSSEVKAFKHSIVQLRVAQHDLHPAVQSRVPPHTDTWATALQQERPGSFMFESPPTLTKTAWEYERLQLPSSQWTRRSAQRSTLLSHFFDQLPREVMHCIVDQLEGLHASRAILDVKTLQDDLRALCLVSKRLHRIAREHLYHELHLPPNPMGEQRNAVPFRKRGSRLGLLLRTFIETPALAVLVHHLRVPSSLPLRLHHETTPALDSHNLLLPTFDTLVDIVLKCRNLEQLSGYTPMATNAAADLFTALSTCTQLKAHMWHLPASLSNGQDDPLPTGRFIDYHTNWRNLHTLVLWQQPGGCELPPGIVSALMLRLPSLKHLMIKGMRPTEFHNGTLLMLPALSTLRLEDLQGITDHGIQQLAHSRLALSVEKLSFCGLELTSLRTIQTLFANLPKIQSFTLVQHSAPKVQRHVADMSKDFTLSSSTLEKLHWDVITASDSTATLADSIAAGHFPALRRVSVPWDYDGAVQNLCRPIPSKPITSEDLHAVENWKSSRSMIRDYRIAEVQAQVRIREKRAEPSFDVVVQKDDEGVERKHFIGSYLGNMASKIEFSLGPGIDSVFDALI
ncbi:hypothetical protein LTR37_006820 [Vermiconidia calcicola]|uniref:Uncharacterized protein n=1 Tax=Vermiconidia calcicola TaxID=1690605 RepID=A0ACC3NGG6_9PEZI|nr:hypothetical protein LTR37_006820 [Vermiconidia calcicola]